MAEEEQGTQRVNVKVLMHIVYTDESGTIVSANEGDEVSLDPKDEEGLVSLGAVKVL